MAKSLALQCQLSRSDQEKITSQEAKSEEIKSVKRWRHVTINARQLGRGRVVRVEHGARETRNRMQWSGICAQCLNVEAPFFDEKRPLQ